MPDNPKPVGSVAVAPVEPAAPTLVWRAPHALSVSWTTVATVQTWTVRWRTAATTNPRTRAGDWQSRTGLARSILTYQIDRLAADTAYDVQVVATNSDGDSPRSDSLTVTTQEAEDMTILQSDLTKIQIGVETTAGTLVAATQRVPFTGASYTPTVERETLEEMGNVLADVDDVVVMRGSELELTEVLSTETLIPALLCSLASVASSAEGGAREWEFTPAVTSPSALGTATIEIDETDGGSSGYKGRFGFARATALSIEASDGIAQLTTTWTGRAKQPLANAANVTPPARWIIPAALFKCYINDSWATLGDTAVGVVRSFTLDVDPGVAGAEALTGRADLDVSYWRRGRIRGNLNMVVDHDADTTSELAHWEAGDLRYVRLAATNGASGAAHRSLTIDLCTRYIDSPDVLAMSDDVHTLDLASQLRADSGNNIMRVTVINGLTSW